MLTESVADGVILRCFLYLIIVAAEGPEAGTVGFFVRRLLRQRPQYRLAGVVSLSTSLYRSLVVEVVRGRCVGRGVAPLHYDRGTAQSLRL